MTRNKDEYDLQECVKESVGRFMSLFSELCIEPPKEVR